MRLYWMLLLTAALATSAEAQDRKSERMSKMEQRQEFVTRFAGEPKSSVPFTRSYDFEPLGRHTLLLYESMSRAYRIEIEDFCPDLPTAMAIGVENKTSTLNAKFDALRIAMPALCETVTGRLEMALKTVELQLGRGAFKTVAPPADLHMALRAQVFAGLAVFQPVGPNHHARLAQHHATVEHQVQIWARAHAVGLHMGQAIAAFCRRRCFLQTRAAAQLDALGWRQTGGKSQRQQQSRRRQAKGRKRGQGQGERRERKQVKRPVAHWAMHTMDYP